MFQVSVLQLSHYAINSIVTWYTSLTLIYKGSQILDVHFLKETLVLAKEHKSARESLRMMDRRDSSVNGWMDGWRDVFACSTFPNI